jgi:hypothetical protein
MRQLFEGITKQEIGAGWRTLNECTFRHPTPETHTKKDAAIIGWAKIE